MPAHAWPADDALPAFVLTPSADERICPGCGRRMWICDHRFRRVEGFQGPRRLVCKLLRCPDRTCSAAGKTFSPEAEAALAHPRWIIDWQVFAWIGQRRFARHWSVPQLRHELADTYRIVLSDAVLEDYVGHYERMLAARHQDPAQLAQRYAQVAEVRLSIDGIQPEMGHETLYVVRELNAGLVWFAEPLLSSTAADIETLLVRAQQLAAGLGKPVTCWVSDKQEAFVTGIAKVFPGVPHRLCKIHFVRALAAEVTAQDSHVKVQMRKKIRGLADIERAALATTPPTPTSAVVAPSSPAASTLPLTSPANDQDAAEKSAVVLDYCAAVRGILRDDQGSALNPTGLRMAAALTEVSASLSRCVAEKKLPLRMPS